MKLSLAIYIYIRTSYVECTSSAIQGLLLFKKMHPSHRRDEIETCIERAIHYIEKSQEGDGSWYVSCHKSQYIYMINVL